MGMGLYLVGPQISNHVVSLRRYLERKLLTSALPYAPHKHRNFMMLMESKYFFGFSKITIFEKIRRCINLNKQLDCSDTVDQ